MVFEHASEKIKVRDTDNGRKISDKINDLKMLLEAFEIGKIKENSVR